MNRKSLNLKPKIIQSNASQAQALVVDNITQSVQKGAACDLILTKVTIQETKHILSAVRACRLEHLFQSRKLDDEHAYVQVRDITPSIVYTIGYLTNHYAALKELRKNKTPIITDGSNNQR